MSYFEPVQPSYEPVSYFENYDRYRYEHPNYPGMPLKEDDFWDLIAPTSDSQTMSRVRFTAPDSDKFSQDAFWATDPILRGPLAEALHEGDGDTIAAYDTINTPEYKQALLDRIGKTEWNQLRAAGILPQEDLPGEELDKMALDYYMRGIENSLATGSPTMQRNAGILDTLSQRYGGRPYPGGELPGFEGPGFGGVGAEQQGGAAGPGGGGNAGTGMPDPDMMGRMDDALYRNPGLAESPRNAYHAALQSRLRQRGYTQAGRERNPNRGSTRRFFESNAKKKESRQNRREAASFFNRGVRNMSSRNARSGNRVRTSSNRSSPRRRSSVNPRTFASYYGRR